MSKEQIMSNSRTQAQVASALAALVFAGLSVGAALLPAIGA